MQVLESFAHEQVKLLQGGDIWLKMKGNHVILQGKLQQKQAPHITKDNPLKRGDDVTI